MQKKESLAPAGNAPFDTAPTQTPETHIGTAFSDSIHEIGGDVNSRHFLRRQRPVKRTLYDVVNLAKTKIKASLSMPNRQADGSTGVRQLASDNIIAETGGDVKAAHIVAGEFLRGDEGR